MNLGPRLSYSTRPFLYNYVHSYNECSCIISVIEKFIQHKIKYYFNRKVYYITFIMQFLQKLFTNFNDPNNTTSKCYALHLFLVLGKIIIYFLIYFLIYNISFNYYFIILVFLLVLYKL